jgi:hypothetical protein
MLLRRFNYANTAGLILRRTFPELYKSHIVKLFEEFPEIRPWYNEQRKEVVFPNGSRLFFGSAEHEADMNAFYSSEFADIMPDEAQEFSESELNKLRGSNRCTSNRDITPKMIYTFMPGVGRGLSYLKRLFIDKQFQPEEGRRKWAFVQAFSWDNIEWARKELERDGVSESQFYAWPEAQRRDYFINRTEYGANLASLTDEYLRDAWLYGKWNAFEGQVFPELRDEIHNLDNFAPPNWKPPLSKLVSAMDWADSGVAALLGTAVDPEENLYALREYYDRNKTVTEHAANATGLLAELGPQDYTLMDLPVNNINQQNLFSIQDAFRRAGLHTIQAHRANIQIGLDLLKEMLRVDPNRVHPFTQQLGAPRLFISRRGCPNLWKEATELQRAIDAETGKVKYVGADHAVDDLRYIAMSRPKAPERAKLAPSNLPVFTFDQKIAGSLGKFDKTFGRDPSENSWWPKA